MNSINRYPTIQASRNAVADIEKITRPGQSPELRSYRAGYEQYLNKMPILDPSDELLDVKVEFTRQIMKALANDLLRETWVREKTPQIGFKRTILAVEPPNVAYNGKEGTEILVAHWGIGHTSPVHGHADGYMHEEVLFGKLRVNTYQVIDPIARIVVPLKTEIVGPGTFASIYSMPQQYSRMNLVHNFTAIEPTATLHYLPEHTRDGYDNKFGVLHFDDFFDLAPEDVERLTSRQGMYMQPGDVALVRSDNVPEYGDHYIVVTGPPVKKEHGMRIQDVAIHVPFSKLLNSRIYVPNMGLTLLRLKPRAREIFLDFHNINVVGGEVHFSKD